MHLALFALLGLVAFALGQWGFSPESGLIAIQYTGYWILLLTFCLFAYAWWRIVRHSWPGWASLLTRKHACVALLILVMGYFLNLHDTKEYKIIMDEPTLVATSLSMHEAREVMVPVRAHELDGVYMLLGGYVDKRPAFFPFLISLLHDWSGYRVENAFYLNGALCFVLLFLTYLLGARLSSPSGGMLAILLMGSIPLLAQTVNSAGFELLNMVMILLILYAAMRYYEDPSEIYLSALALTLVLAAQVRYETVLFIIPVGALIVLKWLELRKISIAWGLWLTPVLLIPYLWQHKAFEFNENLWELLSKPGAEQPFSLGYLADNFAHTLYFFFSVNQEDPNAWFLSLVGGVGAVFFVFYWLRNLSRWSAMPGAFRVFGVVGFGFIGLLCLYLCYYWGQLDDPVVSRLTLPLHIPLVLAPIAVVYGLSQHPYFRRFFGAAVVLAWVMIALPSMTSHTYSKKCLPAREMHFAKKFIEQHRGERFLMVCDAPVMWIPFRVESISFARAEARKEMLAYYLREPHAPPVYVYERLDYDPIADTATPTTSAAGEVLGDNFLRETMLEEKVTPLYWLRISRLKGIEGVDLVASEPSTSPEDYYTRWAYHLP